jgi:hypothetical protein
MKTTLHLLLFTAWIAFTIPTALAQDPAAPSKKEQLATELITMFKFKDNMEGVFKQMSSMMTKSLDAQTTSPEEREKRLKSMELVLQEARKAIDWKPIEVEMIKIYTEKFDEKDLEDIIAFFKTPAGAKWLEKQPEIQAETMQSMQKILPQIQAATIKALSAQKEKAKSE